MTVMAVIPCLNEAAHLDSLLEQFLRDECVDLLVVADGGSSDGSQEITRMWAARDPRVRLLNNHARIQSAGVNLAVIEFGANYEWLLRVDAHCVYPDDYARILLDAAREHGTTAVVVPMKTEGKAGFQVAAAAAQNSVLGTGGSAHRTSGQGMVVDHGHHALVSLEMFRRIGGYCEAMPCNEDAELDYRQIQFGGRIWLEPKAQIVYFPRETVEGLWKQYFRYGVGRARTIQRHRMRPRLRQFLPLAVPVALAALPLAIFHWAFSLPLILWLAACVGAGLIVGWRQRSAWGMLSGLAAAIMHAAWGLGFLWEFFTRPAHGSPQYGLARD